MQDLDSHQTQSSHSSAIECLNLFHSSPNLFCILKCNLYTLYDTLFDYNLGVLAGLTLFKYVFFDFVKCSILVHDISKINEVIGIGPTIHKFLDTKGRFVCLPQAAFQLSSSKVGLLSSNLSSAFRRKEHHLRRSS